MGYLGGKKNGCRVMRNNSYHSRMDILVTALLDDCMRIQEVSTEELGFDADYPPVSNAKYIQDYLNKTKRFDEDRSAWVYEISFVKSMIDMLEKNDYYTTPDRDMNISSRVYSIQYVQTKFILEQMKKLGKW
jgi:hypothetical protein